MYNYRVSVRCFYGEEFEEDIEFASIELDYNPDEVEYIMDADWLFDEVTENNEFDGRPIEIVDIKEEY